MFISLVLNDVDRFPLMLVCRVCMLFSEISLCFVLIFRLHCYFLLLLSFETSFHILDTGPLSHAGFANTSSPSVAHLFILFTQTFTEQKVLILMRSNVSNFPCMAVLLGSSLRTRCLTLEAEDFFCVLFIRGLQSYILHSSL